ncbi:MAG: ferredoxin domain-containing protein [Chloroflexota bacterium]
MARIDAREAEHEAVRLAATLMAAAARTAPKTRGLDSVRTLVIDGEDLEALAKVMEEKAYSGSLPRKGFLRDAGNVRRSAAVLLIGVTGEPKNPENPLNCGACGFGSCAGFLAAEKGEGDDFQGPLCVFQSIDLGIALGAVAKMASELNIDNRIMFTVGAAARSAGMVNADVVIGLPLSVSGKSPYFDR